MVEAVTKALLEFEECPAGVRQMLLEGLPHAVEKAASGERHEYQEQFVSLVRDTLHEAHSRAAEQEASWSQEFQTVEGQIRELQVIREEAAKNREAEAQEVSAKADSLQEVKKVVKRAEREHKEAEHASKVMKKSFTQLEEKKAQSTAMLEGPLRMLLDGGWEDDEAKTAAQEAVKVYLEAIRAEDVLVVAAYPALGLKPESRHEFDKVSVQAVTEVMEGKAAELSAEFARVEPQVTQVSAEILGLWAIMDIEQKKEEGAAKALAEANEALDAATLACQEAQGKVVEREEALRTSLSQREQRSAKVQELQDVLATFERLAAGECTEAATAEPQDEAIAAEPEDAVMADGGEVAAPPAGEVGDVDMKVADAGQNTSRVEVANGNPLNVPTPMVAVIFCRVKDGVDEQGHPLSQGGCEPGKPPSYPPGYLGKPCGMARASLNLA